jgi:N-acetylglutamate synthase-like GNAT family acetyltransferase
VKQFSVVPLRPSRPDELEEVLALLREAELPERGVAECFGDFVVARRDGKLVGVCGLEVHGADALLRSAAVVPELRGSGLGSRLVEATVEAARCRGLRALYLLTTTARPFFLARGFRDAERDAAPDGIRDSWEFRDGCPASSAFMKREL